MKAAQRAARPRSLACAIVSAILSYGVVSAQGPSSQTGPVTLTIDEAVRQALDHNLTLVAERYSVPVAQARIAAAQLRPNPVLTVTGMLPDSTVFQENISPREAFVRGDFIFEGGGKRERRIDVAEAAKSVVDVQLLNTMRTVMLDVQSAFVDVVLAEENVALARESRNALDALVQVNTERVRTGDLSAVELTRSRLAALQFQNDVRQQEARLAVARHRLGNLIGRRDGASIQVSGDLRRDQNPLDLDAIRRLATERRPDLQALRRDQARSAADVRLQIAQGKIDYTLSGEFHRQEQATPANQNTGNLYGVSLSVPLPVFNRNQGEIARARQEEQQSEARIRALEAQISTEVQSAFETYTAARDVVTTIESQMLEPARDVRTTTEYSYRRGEASFIELLDAVRAFNDTMQSYNDARAEYARSLYAIESISGAPLPTQTAQENP
ncbi:MAG TPA: TolC family protein [Vicinamibacterales bacterium]|jgi:cobalt-zinc-cadmium efflux system outer membrane protein